MLEVTKIKMKNAVLFTLSYNENIYSGKDVGEKFVSTLKLKGFTDGYRLFGLVKSLVKEVCVKIEVKSCEKGFLLNKDEVSLLIKHIQNKGGPLTLIHNVVEEFITDLANKKDRNMKLTVDVAITKQQ